MLLKTPFMGNVECTILYDFEIMDIGATFQFVYGFIQLKVDKVYCIWEKYSKQFLIYDIGLLTKDQFRKIIKCVHMGLCSAPEEMG